MEKIKLYTEIEIIPKSFLHTFLLIPFLGSYPELEKETDPDKGRFKAFQESGKDYFTLVDDPALSE